MGQLAGNHFATIVEGAEQLPELGRVVLWEGAQPIVFEDGLTSLDTRSSPRRHLALRAAFGP